MSAVDSPMEARTLSRSRFISNIAAERVTALATPAARLLLAASVVMAAISVAANLAALDDITTDASIELVMHASTVATLVFSLLAGLYSATTDHRFGLFDQRLLSDPRRGRVFGAKLVISALVGLLYGLLGACTAIVSSSALFAMHGETFDATSPFVLKALVGLCFSTPLFAVIGVSVGTAVRNQPLAIGGSLAWMLILEPVVLVGLPDVAAWLPGAAGLALTNSPDPALLSQVAGGLSLGIYAAAAMWFALRRFEQADL